MAKQISASVGGVVKTISDVYCGRGGVVKEIDAGYCSIGGVVKQFYSGKTWLYNNGDNVAGVLGFCNNYEDDITYNSSYIQIPADYGTGIYIPDTTYDLSKYTKLCVTIMYNSAEGSCVHFDLSGVSDEWPSPYPAIERGAKVTYELDISGDTDVQTIKLYIQSIRDSTGGSVTNKTKFRVYELWLE